MINFLILDRQNLSCTIFLKNLGYQPFYTDVFVNQEAEIILNSSSSSCLTNKVLFESQLNLDEQFTDCHRAFLSICLSSNILIG